MARKRTGTVQPFTRADGTVVFRARLRLADGSRPWVDLPGEAAIDEAEARIYAAQLQALENGRGELSEPRRAEPVPVADVLAGDAWFVEWIKARKRKGLTSTADNEAHYRLHIRPTLDGKHVRDWTGDDLRQLVAYLDGKIATRDLSPKFAANVFGTATKMCADASRSKLATLRVRGDNPALEVEGPDRGEDRAKQYLYPTEFLKLVACEDVQLRWRRAIALAVYLGLRAGELRALRWESVDLEHATAHIHEAFERRTRQVKSTKSGRSRRLTLEPAILPLLRTMHAEADGKGSVIAISNRLASRLRIWLERAGVTRRELTDETSTTTKPLAWHDLRGTYCTWCAVRGDPPLQIMQRAGHARFETTMLYVREAEAVRAGFGVVFPPLPASLLGPSTEGLRSNKRSKGLATYRNLERDTGFEAETARSISGLSPGYLGTAVVGGEEMRRDNLATGGDVDQSLDRSDELDLALARALSAAVEAGRLDLVASLVEELRVRRLDKTNNIFPLDVARSSGKSKR